MFRPEECSYPILSTQFEKMSATRQVETVALDLLNYLSTVENRITTARLPSLTANTARFFAFANFNAELIRVGRGIGQKLIMGTGMVDFDPASATNIVSSIDRDQLMSDVGYLTLFNPDHKPYNSVANMKQTLQHQKIVVANRCSREVVGNYPGLTQHLISSASSPEDQIRHYMKSRSSFKILRKIPEHLIFASTFIRQMNRLITVTTLESKDEELSRLLYLVSPMMTSIRGSLGIFEQRVIKQVIQTDRRLKTIPEDTALSDYWNAGLK